MREYHRGPGVAVGNEPRQHRRLPARMSEHHTGALDSCGGSHHGVVPVGPKGCTRAGTISFNAAEPRSNTFSVIIDAVGDDAI